jgi:hypothetical protein
MAGVSGRSLLTRPTSPLLHPGRLVRTPSLPHTWCTSAFEVPTRNGISGVKWAYIINSYREGHYESSSPFDRNAPQSFGILVSNSSFSTPGLPPHYTRGSRIAKGSAALPPTPTTKEVHSRPVRRWRRAYTSLYGTQGSPCRFGPRGRTLAVADPQLWAATLSFGRKQSGELTSWIMA